MSQWEWLWTKLGALQAVKLCLSETEALTLPGKSEIKSRASISASYCWGYQTLCHLFVAFLQIAWPCYCCLWCNIANNSLLWAMGTEMWTLVLLPSEKCWNWDSTGAMLVAPKPAFGWMRACWLKLRNRNYWRQELFQVLAVQSGFLLSQTGFPISRCKVWALLCFSLLWVISVSPLLLWLSIIYQVFEFLSFMFRTAKSLDLRDPITQLANSDPVPAAMGSSCMELQWPICFWRASL